MDMDLDYCLSELKALLSIDSPSGFTDRAAEHLMQALETLGYQPKKTRKGGVLCCLGGEGDGLLLMAHVDTLGCRSRRSAACARRTARRKTAGYTRAFPVHIRVRCKLRTPLCT